jgi:23S rRNA pseudouridine1911/1915/1917 synthase
MTNLRRLLPPPSVLFSTNHLLIINKPPGWSSIPTKSGPDKSVLDYLVAQKLGGGSRGEFLIPLHRIDQPCSGVLLLAKTSKAASRVTQIWKKHEVEKTYLCVVEKPLTSLLRDWNRLEGWIPKGKTKGSVTILREPRDHTRHISLEWRSVHRNRQLVQVRTHMGARHMVRALLASFGHSIAGDLRYQARKALPDQSVALHAQSVILPSSFKLGSVQQTYFEAPMPSTWETFFGIQNMEAD